MTDSSGDPPDRAEGSLPSEGEFAPGSELSEIIRNELPANEPIRRDQLVAILRRIETVVSFQGPLPPPQMLEHYERVLPGLAGRIVDRADREQALRHEIVRGDQKIKADTLWHAVRKTYAGQASAFTLAALSITGGLWLLAHDKDVQGFGTIILTLATLSAAFLGSKWIESRSATKNGTDHAPQAKGDASSK